MLEVAADLGRRDRRAVAGEDRLRRNDRLKIGKDALLELELLGAASNSTLAAPTASASRSCVVMRSRIAMSEPSRSTMERSRCGSDAPTSAGAP